MTLKLLDSERSGEILIRSSGISDDAGPLILDEVNKCAFQRVITTCDGLPLVLGIAGRAIAIHRETTDTNGATWASFDQELRKQITERDMGLNCIISASLTITERIITPIGSLSISEMFRSLCITRRRQWTPIAVLGKMWGLFSVQKTLDCVRILEDLGLVTGEVIQNCETPQKAIRLHDLVYDCCVEETERIDGGCEFWHKKLLREYSKLLQKTSSPRDGALEWWAGSITYDGYFYFNLSRHLVGAGRIDELKQLLLDFRWTLRRWETCGLWGVEFDFEVLLKSLQATAGSSGGSQQEEEWKLIAQAIRMSRKSVPSSPHEYVFQMFGRLVSLRKETSFVDQYLYSMATHLKSPYAVPLTKCLAGPGHRLLNSEAQAGAITCVVATNKPNEVVIGATGGHLKLLRYCNRKYSSWERIRRFIGHSGHIHAVAISRDGMTMVSVSKDNTVRLWDVNTSGVPATNMFTSKTSEVLARSIFTSSRDVCTVGICPAGNIVVWGDSAGTINIWNTRRKAKAVKHINGHDERVNTLAVSPDGDSFITGGRDGSIKVWDMHSGRCVQVLCDQMAPVQVLTWIGCSSSIVSGGDDGVIRRWNIKTGRQVGEALFGHYAPVRSLAVSPNGVHVVSSGADKTIRTWDLSTGCEVGESLEITGGTASLTTKVTVSADGEYIMSGSNNGVLKLWQTIPNQCRSSCIRQGKVMRLAAGLDSDCAVPVDADDIFRVWSAKAAEMMEGIDLNGNDLSSGRQRTSTERD